MIKRALRVIRVKNKNFKRLVCPYRHTVIVFSHNKIKELDSTLFTGLTNLEWINFNYNKIKHLNSSTFNGLTSLEYIFLINNKIKVIDPLAFNDLLNLKQIYLAENKIQTLDLAHSKINILNTLESFK